MQLTGACVFAQSGGPTSVINSSAYGVFMEALSSPQITKVYGASHGIKGVLNDELYDITLEDQSELEYLKNTPSSILGSCRYKLKDPAVDDSDYMRILEIFKKYDIRYFFYNGGNDSMDTCNKISAFLSRHDYACNVMGVPKTIDNDLFGTDHCPGYGSAAKFVSTAVAEIYQDAHVYDSGQITIIECMGRNAGWLTAAAALPQLAGCGPDLIYMPETEFDLDKCMDDIARCYKETGYCLAVISEGVKDKNGVFLAEYSSQDASTDAFGHKQMGGAALFLAAEAKKRTGGKTRAIEFSLLQRCGAHVASKTDVDEAVLLGREAVRQAVSGVTGKMVALTRLPGEAYQVKIDLIDLAQVANAEHKFPLEWITDCGTGIKQEFFAYALPLIEGENSYPRENGLPRFARLKKIAAAK